MTRWFCTGIYGSRTATSWNFRTKNWMLHVSRFGVGGFRRSELLSESEGSNRTTPPPVTSSHFRSETAS
eukprot:scaffold1433_cov132-Skeletonema_menzelii.AAC.4